jgi:hypothetical protein
MKKTKDGKEENGKKVFFHHFTGVAPSMYRRAFSKDRDLKDDDGGLMKNWGR